MDGITDAPMRDLQGATGTFTYAVSEFVRVSHEPVPTKVFVRDVPELNTGSRTPSGMPVQVQILGGHPERMALSAQRAVEAGALAIDINFGCPAPTVNRNDGGASLLREPCRIREVVQAVRSAVPSEIPVSAKLRLGWDNIDDVFENAAMAAEGGATWITLHARTRVQAYNPPVFWPHVGRVREQLQIPVITNGDIWTLDDFRRCQDETGCIHYMIGRGALANPLLSYQIAEALGIRDNSRAMPTDWVGLCNALVERMPCGALLQKLKQWLKLATRHGEFAHFDAIKRCTTVEELMGTLRECSQESP